MPIVFHLDASDSGNFKFFGAVPQGEWSSIPASGWIETSGGTTWHPTSHLDAPTLIASGLNSQHVLRMPVASSTSLNRGLSEFYILESGVEYTIISATRMLANSGDYTLLSEDITGGFLNSRFAYDDTVVFSFAENIGSFSGQHSSRGSSSGHIDVFRRLISDTGVAPLPHRHGRLVHYFDGSETVNLTNNNKVSQISAYGTIGNINNTKYANYDIGEIYLLASSTPLEINALASGMAFKWGTPLQAEIDPVGTGILSLFLKVVEPSSISTTTFPTLYILGTTPPSSGLTSSAQLFIEGPIFSGGPSQAMPLFLSATSSETPSGLMNLYMSGVLPFIDNSVGLFIASSGSTSNIDMFINGTIITDFKNPFFPSDGQIPSVQTISLFLKSNFSPIDLDPQFWINANRAYIDESGTIKAKNKESIKHLSDLTTHNINFTNNQSVTRQPIYKFPDLKCLPVIDRQQDRSRIVNSGVGIGSQFTSFTIIKKRPGINDVIVGDAPVGNTFGIQLTTHISTVEGNGNISAIGGPPGGFGPFMEDDTWVILTHTCSGTHDSHEIFVNGSSILTTPVLGFNSDPGIDSYQQERSIGGDNVGEQSDVVDKWGECIWYNEYLTRNNRIEVEKYLANKWGIFHPSANWQLDLTSNLQSNIINTSGNYNNAVLCEGINLKIESLIVNNGSSQLYIQGGTTIPLPASGIHLFIDGIDISTKNTVLYIHGF